MNEDSNNTASKRRRKKIEPNPLAIQIYTIKRRLTFVSNMLSEGHHIYAYVVLAIIQWNEEEKKVWIMSAKE